MDEPDRELPDNLPAAHAMILELRRELADLNEISHRHAELYAAKLHALRTELEQALGGTLPLQ